MALTNQQKSELKELVKSYNANPSRSKKESIRRIHNVYGYKESTIRKYWEIFNES